MNFKPLKDKIVIDRDAAEEEAHGLYIIDRAREIPNRGTVMAIGSEVEDVHVGSRVIFGKHDGTKVNVDGKDYLVMRENQIWAIIG